MSYSDECMNGCTMERGGCRCIRCGGKMRGTGPVSQEARDLEEDIEAWERENLTDEERNG